MYDTCTICHCYIVITCNEEALLALLISNSLSTLEKWLVFFSLKVRTLVCLKHFVCFLSSLGVFLGKKCSKNFICKRFSKIICESVNCIYLNVCVIRVYTKCYVTWKCPWCCCPCEEVCILSYYLETDDS